MSDLIDRQKAIDAPKIFTKDCNPEHFAGHPNFIEYMDSVGIMSFGNWQYANGFNMGLTAAEVAIKELPSAESEIVRCKDCKYRDPEDKKCDCGHDITWQLSRNDNWFCADGERRTDERFD